MSALVDELSTIQRPTCQVQAILPALNRADAKAFTAALLDPRTNAAQLSRVMERRGHRLTAGVTKWHRTNTCKACEDAGLYEGRK